MPEGSLIPRSFTALLLIAILLVFFSNASYGQGGPDLFDEDVPVILSASRLIQPVSSAPASTTVIDAEMIRFSGARTIVDILRLVPGFQVGRLVNGNPIATQNGLSERYNPRLQLIIDGRPTYVPLYGGIPWSELPVALTDIERVEVTRAPNAATFGPNSYAAVVSITTRAPDAQSGWSVNSEAGGNEFRSGTLTYHGTGRNSHYRVTLQSERDEGFRNIIDRERSTLASVRSHWQLNQNDRLAVDVGAIRGGHMEIDTIVDENDLFSYSEATNAYTQLVWERAQSADDELRLQYYYNFFDINDRKTTRFDLAAASGNEQFSGLTVDADVNRNTRSTRHELEIQRRRRLGDRHRVVFGGALRQDSVQGEFIFNDADTRYVSTQRLFAHSEFNFNPHWLLNSGLMIENNSISDVSASPRLSITKLFAPGRLVRLGYSRGTRTPLLLEEEGMVSFEYQVSNGATLTDLIIENTERITPETIDVVDIAYYHNDTQRRMSVDIKLSYHELRDIIATDFELGAEGDTFDGASRSYRNRFNYRFTTLSLQADRKLGIRGHIRASFAYSLDEDLELSQRQLIPKYTLSLYGRLGFDRTTTLSGEYYYTSSWIWDDVRDESRLNRLDIRLEKQFRLAGVAAMVALQAEIDLGGTTDYLNRNRIDSLYFARVGVQFP